MRGQLWLIMCLGLWLATGPAKATDVSLEDPDGRTATVRLDLPFDLRVENEDGKRAWVTLEGFSDFSDLSPGLGVHLTLSSFGHMNCTEWLAFNKSYYSDHDLLDERGDRLECLIAVADSEGNRTLEWRFWLRECRCYAEVSGGYTRKDRDLFNYIAQPVADSLRSSSHDGFGAWAREGWPREKWPDTIPDDVYDLNEVMTQIGAAQRRTREAAALRDALREKLRARMADEKTADPPETPAGSATFGAPLVGDDAVLFVYSNATPKTLLVEFTEHRTPQKHTPTGHAWPGGNEVYVLNPGQRREFRLRCTPGRQVCMGAEFRDDRMSRSGVFWGKSLDGGEGCSDCCLVCGGVWTERTIEWDGRRNPGGGGGGQLLGAILSVAVGAAIGAATAAPPPVYSPTPTGRDQRKSGLSGF